MTNQHPSGGPRALPWKASRRGARVLVWTNVFAQASCRLHGCSNTQSRLNGRSVDVMKNTLKTHTSVTPTKFSWEPKRVPWRTRKKSVLVLFVCPLKRHSSRWARPDYCSTYQSPGADEGGGEQEQTRHTSQCTPEANRCGHSPPGPTWQWVEVVTVLTQPGALTRINKWLTITCLRRIVLHKIRTPHQPGFSQVRRDGGTAAAQSFDTKAACFHQGNRISQCRHTSCWTPTLTWS